jgi:hypothetical protein
MTNEITRTPAINATVDMENVNDPTLTLIFGNGEVLCIMAHQLTVELAQTAMMHGLKQKLVDAAAISRNPDTGRTASVDDKYNAVKEVFDRLIAGQWNKQRDGAGATKGGLLFRALCMLYADKTPDAIKAFLDKKTATEKTALRNTAKIAAIIATLKEDDDNGDVDVDAMLDELN